MVPYRTMVAFYLQERKVQEGSGLIRFIPNEISIEEWYCTKKLSVEIGEHRVQVTASITSKQFTRHYKFCIFCQHLATTNPLGHSFPNGGNKTNVTRHLPNPGRSSGSAHWEFILVVWRPHRQHTMLVLVGNKNKDTTSDWLVGSRRQPVGNGPFIQNLRSLLHTCYLLDLTSKCVI